jgi:hypothetical protein
LWILVPRVISFWPAAPLYYSNSGFEFHGSLLSGLQHLYMLQGLQCHFIIRGCFHSPPSLFVQAISAIIMTNNGHQSLDFLLLGPAVPQLPFGWRFLLLEIMSHAYIYSCLPKFWWQYTNLDVVCQI